MREISKPIYRFKLRSYLGKKYYSFFRKVLWIRKNAVFAKNRTENLLPYAAFSHKSISGLY